MKEIRFLILVHQSRANKSYSRSMSSQKFDLCSSVTSHHPPIGGSSFSITQSRVSPTPPPPSSLFLPPPHAWIRRQFYTFRTSYLAKTSPESCDYESVPSVDTSTVLHFQHFIIIIIIIKNTNSTTVLHFQHFILTPY